MMRKTLLLVFASLVLSQAEAVHRFTSRRIPDKYIVTLRHTDIKAQMRERLNALLEKFEGHHEIEYDYKELGIAGKLSNELLRAIEAELEGHVDIDNDHHVNMHAATTATSQFTVNQNLWGLDRVDQTSLPLNQVYAPKALDGTGVTAYVVDTGVFNQKEFETRVVSGYDAATNGQANPVDCNGHGTHVAGTIGSVTYGIAKNVNIVGVKVLNCQGSGTSATILNGLAYVANNAKTPAVVNMSLGGTVAATNGKVNGAYSNAFAALNAKNIPVVVAAGNENANACTSTPANEARAITVAASTITDTMASFSNFGRCVDIIAPGNNIQSTYLNAQVSVLSGTSMAAPHVAGVVALMLQANPALTPAQVKAQLVANAITGKITSTGNKMATTVNAFLQIPKAAATTPTPATPTPSPTASQKPISAPSPSPSKQPATSPAAPAPGNDGKPTYPWLPPGFYDYLPWELVPAIDNPYIPYAPKNVQISQSDSEVVLEFDVDAQTSLNCLNTWSVGGKESMCVNRVDHCSTNAANVTHCTISGSVDGSQAYSFTIQSKSFEGGVSTESAKVDMNGGVQSLSSGSRTVAGVASVVIGGLMSMLFL